MKSNKKTKILLCFLLVILTAVFTTGFFVAAEKQKPAEVYATGNGWESKYVNRVDFQIDSTEFVFIKSDNGKYVFRFTFTAEKTEPDFYAILDSFSLTGIPYTKLTITADDANDGVLMIPGSILPTTKQEKTAPLSWTAEVEFSAQQGVTYTPTLQIGYTSGTSYALKESYRADVPFTVKVTDLGNLPTVLDDAERLFTLGIYTQDSLDTLREKMDDIYYALRSPQSITQEMIDQWLTEIESCISALKPI
ncbi:MAG: hypothetical protein IJO14_03905 [Clostridia bacterium]|nr:hypothetical protein [Clostridia bacterium]